MQELLSFTIVGIVTGAIYAVAASGLVLTYTTTGVFNFAHGAVGMVAAFAYWQLRVDWGWPTPIAVVVVLFGVAPAMGAVVEVLMRRFHGADVGTLLVITIGLTVMLIGAIQSIYEPAGRFLPPLISDTDGIRVADILVSWDQITILLIAAAVAAALRFLLFSTRTGVGMRAVVDNPDLAGLNGARPTVIARMSWMLGFGLAALAGILIGPAVGLNATVLTFLVINAYAAAMVGRLTSLPLTFAGALGLGLLEAYAIWAINDFGLQDTFDAFFTRLRPSLPTVFLFIALLALPASRLSVGRVVGSATPRVPSLRESVVVGVLFVAAVAALAPFLPADNLTDITLGLVYAVVMLSLVALTGFAGLVSLGQLVFVGLGGWAMSEVFGGGSIFGMLAGAAIAVPVGALVALPSLRLHGLYLALSTFAFALLAKTVIFQDPRVFGGGNVEVGRLELLGVSFAGDRMFLVLCALVFAAVGVGVLVLRRSALGRQLTAMRDSEAACATLGLDIRRQKLVIFMISAAIAGLAGALLGGLRTTMGEIDVNELNNLPLFLLAVVGGITTVTGALIGGGLLALLPYLQSKSQALGGMVFLAIGVAAIALGKQPNGIVGMAGDRWQRFVAGLQPSSRSPDSGVMRDEPVDGETEAVLSSTAAQPGGGS